MGKAWRRSATLQFNDTNDEQIVAPYSRLASIYDLVMAHVDYQHWARYVQRIIQKWHPQARRLLDISCGTGSLLFQLDLRTYRVFGFDLSFDMVRIARMKAQSLVVPIPIWQNNMTSFRLREPVDVVICLYDSINYLLDSALWIKLLNRVHEELADPGIFIFDICTEKNSKRYFDNFVEKDRGKGYRYIRESKYNSEIRIHTNRFTMNFDSDPMTYIEHHQQRILLVRDVVDLIAATPFQLVGAYDDFTFSRANENSLRIHFALKKSQS